MKSDFEDFHVIFEKNGLLACSFRIYAWCF